MQTAREFLQGLPEVLLHEGQRLLDKVTHLPLGLAWTALGLALLFTLLHRHALRPLSALVLGGLCAALSLLVLAPRLPLDSGVPGVVAVVTAGASLGLGLARPAWASALISMCFLGGLGAAGAVKIAKLDWLFGAAPFGLLGFFTGLANPRLLSLWMPPLWSALLCTLAVARLTNGEGALAQAPAFSHPPFAGGLLLVLSVVLLAVSLEREHRSLRRLEQAKGKKASDEAIRKRVAAQNRK